MHFIENFTSFMQGSTYFKPDMCSGASEIEVNELEASLQLTLPNDFKAFYSVYNGQNDLADSLFDTFYLCNLRQIYTHWKALRDNEKEFSENQIEADNGIQSIWCCSKWVPFASTADGHLLCMDFSPTIDGISGQVITFWYNAPEREILAKSFSSFIEDNTARLEKEYSVFEHSLNE